MKSATRFACLVPVILLAVSCGRDDAAERKLPANGEILERSISDDMLPYDTVRSQPPLLEPARKADGAGGSREAGPSPSVAADGSEIGADAAADAATDDEDQAEAPSGEPSTPDAE